MKKSETILFAVGIALLLGIITLAAVFSVLVTTTRQTKDAVYIAGVAALAVDTNSMAPLFDRGDLIFIADVDPGQLQVGDVACFRTRENGQNTLNTHRIVSITVQEGHRYYLTQGDNMEFADQQLHAEGDVVGVFRNQRLGGAARWMEEISDGFGIICFILLPLILFLVVYIRSLVLRLNKLKQTEAAATMRLARSTWREADRVRAEADSVRAELARHR